jgi:hypothetical protein
MEDSEAGGFNPNNPFLNPNASGAGGSNPENNPLDAFGVVQREE